MIRSRTVLDDEFDYVLKNVTPQAMQYPAIIGYWSSKSPEAEMRHLVFAHRFEFYPLRHKNCKPTVFQRNAEGEWEMIQNAFR